MQHMHIHRQTDRYAPNSNNKKYFFLKENLLSYLVELYTADQCAKGEEEGGGAGYVEEYEIKLFRLRND